MSRVISLADHRKKRIRSALSHFNRSDRDCILIELDAEGTHSVTITGAYVTTIGLAAEAVAEVLVYLLRTGRTSGIP